MEEKELKIFNDDSSKVSMPSISSDELNEQNKLKSHSIDSAISGTTVKKLIVPEESNIEDKNFIFDFTDIDSISVFQMDAIKSFIDSDGDVALYLYNKNGMVKFGYGDKFKLERIIPLVKFNVFDNKLKVYKNYHKGDIPVQLESTDITKLRLNL